MMGVVGRAGPRWPPHFRSTGVRMAFAAFGLLTAIVPAPAETLSDALVKAYQTNPQLNAERAKLRGTDENIPQALAGYRPQLVASLSAGLQAVRNVLPDNTVQGATLKPWTIGLTVTQILFNGYKTASNVRIGEFQVKSGRAALRNVAQGVLLDAVTAYMNVMANSALVEAQRTNVQVLREIQAISKETYAQVIGEPPSQLAAASPIDRLLPVTELAAIDTAKNEHPAVVGAGYDVDVATVSIKLAESALLPTVSVQGSV